MAGLIAEWIFGASRHRLVEISGDFVLERCDRDIPGLELWTQVLNTRGLRDAGGTKCLCRGLEQLAARTAAVAKTMTYGDG